MFIYLSTPTQLLQGDVVSLLLPFPLIDIINNSHGAKLELNCWHYNA